MPPNNQQPMSYSDMQKHKGGPWLLLFVVTLLLLLGALGFGYWAFAGMQDYKNNVDQKVAAQVGAAVEAAETAKDNEFTEKEKSPLKTYSGPSAFGGVAIKYPKTWGAYVDERGAGTSPIDGYFHPRFVPGLQSKEAYALRVQVLNRSYDQELSSFDSKVKQGSVSVKAYKAANVKDVTGSRITGEIAPNISGVMVMFPLRDKTLKIWTEANQFAGDFDNHVLKNLTFSP